MLRPDMNSIFHHLLRQTHQTSTFDICSCRGSRLLPRRWHQILKTVEKACTAVLAKDTIHLSTFEGSAGVRSDEVGHGFGELKVGEDGGDAVGGGALVLAFCAVACVEGEGFVCWGIEFDLRALAASFHAHFCEFRCAAVDLFVFVSFMGRAAGTMVGMRGRESIRAE